MRAQENSVNWSTYEESKEDKKVYNKFMKKHTSKNLLDEDYFSLDAPLKIDIGTVDYVKSNKGSVSASGNASGSSTASAGVASIKINVSKGSKEKGDEKDI